MKKELYLKVEIEEKQDKEIDFQFCPECGSKLIFQEGCVTCINCGWSACS